MCVCKCVCSCTLLHVCTPEHTVSCGTKQDPVGFLGTEAFLSPLSWLQPPWPSLSSKGEIRTVAKTGREGMQKQGRGSQEIIVQAWGRVLVPLQGIHITNSLSSLRCQHSSYQRKTTWGYIKGTRDRSSRRLLETRLEECRPCTRPNLISNPTLEPLL